MQIEHNKLTDTTIGTQWIKQGWETFKQRPVLWLTMILTFGVIMAILSRISIGQIIVVFIAPLLAGGILYALDKNHKGEEVEYMDLFYVFKTKNRLNQLLILGAIGVAVTFVNYILIRIPMGFFLVMILNLAWAIAVAFSVPLIVLEKAEAIDALQTSVNAWLSNAGPMIVYFLMLMGIMIVAMIPFGLGMIIALPVMFCANYYAYRAVFKN